MEEEKRKKNCWEVLQCGRQPGGNEVGHLGVCPAAKLGEIDGINHGKRAGRICWAVSGTFCGGEVQGDFAAKRVSCLTCKFFEQVQTEEEVDFQFLLPGQKYKRQEK